MYAIFGPRDLRDERRHLSRGERDERALRPAVLRPLVNDPLFEGRSYRRKSVRDEIDAKGEALGVGLSRESHAGGCPEQAARRTLAIVGGVPDLGARGARRSVQAGAIPETVARLQQNPDAGIIRRGGDGLFLRCRQPRAELDVSQRRQRDGEDDAVRRYPVDAAARFVLDRQRSSRARDSDDRGLIPDHVAQRRRHGLRQAVHSTGDLEKLARRAKHRELAKHVERREPARIAALRHHPHGFT